MDFLLSVQLHFTINPIIMLAKAVGIKIIAEGVETKEQLDILISLGCEEIQGFYLGIPVPAKEFEKIYLKDFSLVNYS